GSEALLAAARATASVVDAVGARGVPGHADHERAVVAEVGGPPVLGGGEDFGDVALDRGQVQRLEGGLVVEIRAERVALGGVLGEHLQVELVGPPLMVAATLQRVPQTAGGDGATAFGGLRIGLGNGWMFHRHGVSFQGEASKQAVLTSVVQTTGLRSSRGTGPNR